MIDLKQITENVKALAKSSDKMTVEEFENVSVKIGHILDLLTQITYNLNGVLNILEGVKEDLERRK